MTEVHRCRIPTLSLGTFYLILSNNLKFVPPVPSRSYLFDLVKSNPKFVPLPPVNPIWWTWSNRISNLSPLSHSWSHLVDLLKHDPTCIPPGHRWSHLVNFVKQDFKFVPLAPADHIWSTWSNRNPNLSPWPQLVTFSWLGQTNPKFVPPGTCISRLISLIKQKLKCVPPSKSNLATIAWQVWLPFVHLW
jgi:hypothetical protein